MTANTEKCTVTLEDQLKNGVNFLSNGRLYLKRCVRCDRENWAPSVASGVCAWCTWSDQSKLQPEYHKCGHCGWVHVAIDAEPTERMSRCFRCRAPVSGFMPATEEDAPQGATIQPISKQVLGVPNGVHD